MMTRRRVALALAVALITVPVIGNAAGGRLVDTTIAAPSIAGNMFEIPAQQPVAIYLPPSYESSVGRFPVVYFLTGFEDVVYYFTFWAVYQGFNLKQSMDTLIAQGKIAEMIVVIPNGRNFTMGSFYVNSPVTGNWEDFITTDLVHAIDTRYRTLPYPESRGIGGHSMGGFGAINIAMRHPDIFGAAYGMSPGLFAPGALEQHVMFADPATVESRLSEMARFAAMPDSRAKPAFMSFINYLIEAGDHQTVFSYAYGAAFSPNPQGKTPFIDYPYRKSERGLEKSEIAWGNYERGFGGLAEKVKQNHQNLLTLRMLTFDVGTRDEYPWIVAGCDYFSKLLDSAGVTHQLVTFDGGHNDHIRERIEDHLLPAFSKSLKFNPR